MELFRFIGGTYYGKRVYHRMTIVRSFFDLDGFGFFVWPLHD